MATLREWIGRFEQSTSETIDKIVLGGGEYDWTGEYTRRDDWPDWDQWNIAVPLAEVPVRVLDNEFHDGFGGNDSPNLCAWSANWVMFSDNYDGAEGPCWVPRNPIDHEPTRPGGG